MVSALLIEAENGKEREDPDWRAGELKGARLSSLGATKGVLTVLQERLLTLTQLRNRQQTNNKSIKKIICEEALKKEISKKNDLISTAISKSPSKSSLIRE